MTMTSPTWNPFAAAQPEPGRVGVGDIGGYDFSDFFPSSSNAGSSNGGTSGTSQQASSSWSSFFGGEEPPPVDPAAQCADDGGVWCPQGFCAPPDLGCDYVSPEPPPDDSTFNLPFGNFTRAQLEAMGPEAVASKLGWDWCMRSDTKLVWNWNKFPPIDCVLQCASGFNPLYDNDGEPIECIFAQSGYECTLPSGNKGYYGDKGQCNPIDTGHITTPEQANEYCHAQYGTNYAGYIGSNGKFWGCCPGGTLPNEAADECECPPDTLWDDAQQMCVATDGAGPPGGGTTTPVKGPKPDCVGIYGKSHYVTWSEADGAWACFQCRPDERGQEDGLCYCKPGTVRKDANDPNSPCVPAGKSGGDGDDGDKTPGTTDDKPTGGKEEKSIWPWILGGVAVAAVVGGAIYMSQSSGAAAAEGGELPEGEGGGDDFATRETIPGEPSPAAF